MSFRGAEPPKMSRNFNKGGSAPSTSLRNYPWLLLEDDQAAKRFLRMSYKSFQVLLACVRALIEKKLTLMRKAIPAAERLATTLRYLASGKQYSCHLFVALFIF